MSDIEKRKTVVGIVTSFLKHYYDENKFQELTFDEVNAAVKAVFPDSRFNPYHLAHYKHKFLVKLHDVKMYKGRVRSLNLIPILLLLCGCVSTGYHQRITYQTKQEEIQNAMLLAEQVRDRRMSAKDMIKILEYRRSR